MIKSTLMDQNAIAGVGNIYSDEILFQAKIHPRTATGDLKKRKPKTYCQPAAKIGDAGYLTSRWLQLSLQSILIFKMIRR